MRRMEIRRNSIKQKQKSYKNLTFSIIIKTINTMEDIKIIDNFLNAYELDECLELINQKNWYYGHTSGNYEKFNNKFFAAYNLDDFFSEYIKNKLEIIFSKKFTLDRNYMHIQMYGQDGSYHIDNDRENTYTFCIYITSLSNLEIEDSDGDFLLKIPNTNYVICINTAMNRGVFFPSTYFHKGMAYNHLFPQKRLCITWKLTEIVEN
uniref:Fe2OG dioxygenase domain-containing protein n=1 Tax=viral metagenome TaxID=1070528 RepID=A0A6C0ESS4_9ZZZZ